VMAHEWVATSDDFLWRRSKLGLVVTDSEAAAIDDYVRGRASPASNAASNPASTATSSAMGMAGASA
ncbi:MAG: hypothetical protein VW987_12105, partial [Alphaproteobacteria bacterium]